MGERTSVADLFLGVILALAITVVWVVLGFNALNTSYHFAPLVITLTPVVVVRLRRERRLDLKTTLAALAGGVGAATFGALMLLALVAFDGPTLAEGLSPEGEAIIMVALGVAGGLAVGLFGRNPPAETPPEA